MKEWKASGLKFIIADKDEASFLGSPLGFVGTEKTLEDKSTWLREVGPRLELLAPHEAFFLQKSCFTVPKLLFLLRSALTGGNVRTVTL